MIFTYSSSNLFIRKQYIRLNSCSFCDFKRTQKKMSDNDNSTSFACAIHSFPLRQTVRAFCSTILMRNFNISSLCYYSNIKITTCQYRLAKFYIRHAFTQKKMHLRDCKRVFLRVII